MMAHDGVSRKKDASLSSASATTTSPEPRRAFAPRSLTSPPIRTVGAKPPASSTAATIEVVVVLPCVPETATPFLSAMISASISARCMTGMPARCAATTSGLSGGMADEMTTASAPLMLSDAWPSATRAPSALSLSKVELVRRSEPETETPIARSTRATALMPTPPIPTKCTCFRSFIPCFLFVSPLADASQEYALDHVMQSTRLRQTSRRGTHRGALVVVHDVEQRPVERVGVERRVFNDYSRAARFENLGVLALVVFGGVRIRHEERGQSADGGFGQRRSAGARNDHVGGGVRQRHVVQVGRGDVAVVVVL